MVEYPVENDLDVMGMRLGDQHAQGLITPQQWVNPKVVVGMVAVIRGGLEDGI